MVRAVRLGSAGHRIRELSPGLQPANNASIRAIKASCSKSPITINSALLGMNVETRKDSRSSRVKASSISSVGDIDEQGWAPKITFAIRSEARKLGCAR